MEFDQVKSIGVFKFKHIGDVLLMTPAIRELRQRWPQARITAVIHAFSAPMLEGNPDLDDIIIAKHHTKGAGPLKRMGLELDLIRRIRRQKFDLTIDFGTSERAIWCSLLGGSRRRAGVLYHRWQPGAWQRRIMTHLYAHPTTKTWTRHTHQVLKDIWLVRQLGSAASATVRDDGKAMEVLTEEDTVKQHPLILDISQSDREWAGKFIAPHRPDRIVVVHPVSRWMSKCWHEDRIAQVIDWLQRERQARVILTSSPVEKELEHTRAIEDLCETRPVLVPGTISLKQLAALCEKADAFVGIDSAPMHIAAAVGVPTVALFGPTKPDDWGPWTAKRHVLFHHLGKKDERIKQYKKGVVHPTLDLLTVDEVKQALDEALP